MNNTGKFNPSKMITAWILLILSAALIFNDAFAQQRNHRSNRGIGNSDSWCTDRTGRRVLCPEDVFGDRKRRGDKNRFDADDFVDSTLEWFNWHTQVRHMEKRCDNLRGQGGFANGRLRSKCIAGIQSASIMAKDVAYSIGEMDGYRYGFTYGIDQGVEDANNFVDPLEGAYAPRAIQRGRDEYKNPSLASSIGQNQINAARAAITNDSILEEKAGISRANSDGPNIARKQFEDYTLGKSSSAPNIASANSIPSVPTPSLADPFGAKIGYSDVNTVIEQLNLDNTGYNDFSNYYLSDTVKNEYISRYYSTNRYRPHELYKGGRYRYKKYNDYIPRESRQAFRVWDDYGHYYKFGNREESSAWRSYKNLSGNIPSVIPETFTTVTTKVLDDSGALACTVGLEEFPNNQRGRENAKERLINSRLSSVCLCQPDAGANSGTRPGRTPRVGPALPGNNGGRPGRPGIGRPGNPANPVTPVNPIPAPIATACAGGIQAKLRTDSQQVRVEVNERTAFYIGFTGMFERFFNHNFQKGFADGSDTGLVHGDEAGFQAQTEILKERGRSEEFKAEYNQAIAAAYEGGYTSRFPDAFRGEWNFYNSNPVLEVRALDLVGSNGEDVLRPDEVVSAKVQITNFGGVGTSVSLNMSGSDVSASQNAVVKGNSISPMTAGIVSEIENAAVVLNPMNPIRGIEGTSLRLTVTPAGSGSSKTVNWSKRIQEWVSLSSGNQALSYTINYNDRKGTATVVVQNNSRIHSTPERVEVSLSLDGKSLTDTVSLGSLAAASEARANFDLSGLVPFKLLEGSHSISAEVTHGTSQGLRDVVAQSNSMNLEVSADEKRSLVPEMVNRILMDYGRVVEGIESKYGYVMKVADEEVDSEIDEILATRAKNLLNSVVDAEIRNSSASRVAKSSGVLTGHSTSALVHFLSKVITSYNYNVFKNAINQDDSVGKRGVVNGGRLDITNLDAVNNVPTASYLIEMNNLGKRWYDMADDMSVSRKDKEKIADREFVMNRTRGYLALKTPSGLFKPYTEKYEKRGKIRERNLESIRIEPWEERDMVTILSRPSKAKDGDMVLFWLDGKHPGVVMSTSSPTDFAKYYRGERLGDSQFRLSSYPGGNADPAFFIREVSEWPRD